MAEKKAPTRRNASLNNPTIAAIVEGGYRFANEEQALNQLNAVRDFFTISRQQQEGLKDGQIILWIKSYALTPEEKQGGYTGNFAIISVVKRDKGKFSLEAVKLESELKYHPERRRPKHKHPNWGHPILRAIQKGRKFKAVEDAQAELTRLHEEFPECTIPLSTKLYLIIYSRKDKPPVQKFVLEIQPSKEGDGMFFVDVQRNDFKGVMVGDGGGSKKGRDRDAEQKEATDAVAATPAEDSEEQGGGVYIAPAKGGREIGKPRPKKDSVGHFSAMVELRRQKKKRK